MVCLVETESFDVHSQLLLLGFVDVLEVPPIGQRGGLVDAWQRGISFDVVFCCDNFVNLVITSDPPNQP